MKIIFVDAENVGLKAVKKLKVSILDKVFVFSKNEGVQQYCNTSLFINIADYPPGPNQADFLIISYLSRVLSNLNEDELKIRLELVTNDEALINAYESICQSFNANYQITKTNQKEERLIEDEDVNGMTSLFLEKIEELTSEQKKASSADKIRAEEQRQKIQTATPFPTSAQKAVISLDLVNAEKKILKALNKAHSLDDVFREKLALSKPEFTRAANALIRNNQIQRSAESKKKWIKVS